MLFTASDGWVFFLISSPILDLEHFSQVILRIVLQIMPPHKLPQPSGAVHSIWWLGFFFYLFCYFGLRAFFTSYFMNCTTDYAPPKLPQPSGAVQSIWWFWFFFLTSSLILDLEHFSQVILWIVLQIMPLQINPTIRCCSEHLMVGFVFFLTSSPILDLEHFSQVILWIVLQIMPLQINPTIRCCSQHLMVGFFFWPLLLFWT